ncbi:MAG: phage holin family protein, partial [Anaerolineaceae bacterium]|nr:phage holin family protein [Anaerolineaceae bacterium]
NETGILRTAVIFFFLSNDGLSILENAAHLGLPIPKQLKAVLEQLHDRAEKSGTDKTENLPEVVGEVYTGAHEEKNQ